MQNNEILILCNDYEAIEDLYRWLYGEFDVQFISTILPTTLTTLGEKDNGLKVVLDFAKENWERLIDVVKNWIRNFNKDIEISIHSGSKSFEFKCPSARITDDQLDKMLSSIDDIWKKK